MSQINIRNLSNENDDGAPDIVGVSTLSATSYFVPPVGTTEQRPENPQEGDLRFNTTFHALEYYRGKSIGWRTIQMTSPDLGGGTDSNAGTGARGLFMGGQNPSEVDTIDYITIPTLGNATDFGNLTDSRDEVSSCASRTRGVGGGGYDAGTDDKIDYVTFSSTGDAIDFGNLSVARFGTASLSDQTRGIWAGGGSPTKQDVIDYISIAQSGNAVDFGNLGAANYQPQGC